MKKLYRNPDTLIQSIRYSCVLCSSGEPTPPTSEFNGGNSEGDASGAHAPRRPKVF